MKNIPCAGCFFIATIGDRQALASFSFKIANANYLQLICHLYGKE